MRRKAKAPKGDFSKWDPTEVANQLTLMEARYYKKIRPQECLSWTHSTKGPAVANLTAFVGTSDRLAAWVKLSILTSESLGKRADVISHWIKIAEVSNMPVSRAIIKSSSSPSTLRAYTF
jgi:son of sevenless-like protein